MSDDSDQDVYQDVETVGEERVMLDGEEAARIANTLEIHYYDTVEDAYTADDREAAQDAMMLRKRADIEPNPELLEDDDE